MGSFSAKRANKGCHSPSFRVGVAKRGWGCFTSSLSRDLPKNDCLYVTAPARAVRPMPKIFESVAVLLEMKEKTRRPAKQIAPPHRQLANPGTHIRLLRRGQKGRNMLHHSREPGRSCASQTRIIPTQITTSGKFMIKNPDHRALRHRAKRSRGAKISKTPVLSRRQVAQRLQS